MNKLLFFSLALSFALTSFCQNNNYNPDHLYTVKDLKTDFQFLRTTLEKAHPNLYLYTPKAEFNSFFDSLYKSIKNPLTQMEFYNLITLLNQKIQDGHTMFLPSEASTTYFNQHGKFFPFYVAILNNKLYVNMNCSADTSVTNGAELLSINGIETSDIIKQLLARQIRDGNNKTYPIWILTNYFKEYFGFSFGHPNSFSINFKIGGPQRQITINALPKDSINYYRKAKYSNRIPLTNKEQGITLKIDSQLNIATLSIKSLNNEILKSVYGLDFNNSINKIFSEIDSAHIGNLILDVRNNQGGYFEPSKLLLSYLLRQPVNYLPGSKEAELISPRKKSFKGNVFILINGGSFSATAILCSCLELTNRGIFIGEETAGSKTVISGDPTEITLPNTKILCQISTTKYLIRNSNNNGHGVMPDHYKIATIDELISDKDPAMEFTLKLVQGNN